MQGPAINLHQAGQGSKDGLYMIADNQHMLMSAWQAGWAEMHRMSQGMLTNIMALLCMHPLLHLLSSDANHSLPDNYLVTQGSVLQEEQTRTSRVMPGSLTKPCCETPVTMAMSNMVSTMPAAMSDRGPDLSARYDHRGGTICTSGERMN